MWEVFLYINPLCSYCLKVERSIIDFTRKNNIDTQYHFVTTFNMATITDYMLMKGYKPADLQKRNEVTENIYEAALLYKAAACQGNKKARSFLMNLQNQVNVLGNPFNEDTIKVAVENSGLNFKAIMKEKDSDTVKKAVKKDQELTCQMNIEKAPTVIVFDDDDPSKPGVMINKFGSVTSEDIINENLSAMLEKTMPTAKESDIEFNQQSRIIYFENFRR
ncbi:DsbA family protein [Companilactobacillus furfuricola]|uniref:DsbA family protein n=1 Tax=Companilactobacillus furfuricola TaxID=1462575 RepID=UPI000F778CF8|nr:DsbA family protein [Companilactobacillus furfuricola]